MTVSRAHQHQDKHPEEEQKIKTNTSTSISKGSLTYGLYRFKEVWRELSIDKRLNMQHTRNWSYWPLCVHWPWATLSIWLKYKTNFIEGPGKTGHSWWENSTDKERSHCASLLLVCCSSIETAMLCFTRFLCDQTVSWVCEWVCQ